MDVHTKITVETLKGGNVIGTENVSNNGITGGITNGITNGNASGITNGVTSGDAAATSMASRETVYQCFGRAAELAQLLEMEVGTSLLALDALESKRFLAIDPDAYLRLRTAIESQTLGQALRRMREKLQLIDDLELVLVEALRFRLRLAHRFFPEHGLSMLTEDGRLKMVSELMEICDTLQRAYSVASNVSFALVSSIRQPNSAGGTLGSPIRLR